MFRTCSALAAAAAAAAAPAPGPCYAVINDPTVGVTDITTIETPCATTLLDYEDTKGFRLALRSYPPAAALVVEARVDDDPGATFEDQVFFTSSFLFEYLTGGNAKQQNLTAALTAPFTLRPPVAGRTAEEDWVGTFALAPSVYHPGGSQPPASTLPAVDVAPFGGVTMAVRPVVLPRPPTENDFRSAYAELESSLAFIPLPGRWVINTSSPLSPSFSFFFTQYYNGSAYQIEAAAEVFHVSQ